MKNFPNENIAKYISTIFGTMQNWAAIKNGEWTTVNGLISRQANEYIYLFIFFFVDASNEWKWFDIIFTRFVSRSKKWKTTSTHAPTKTNKKKYWKSTYSYLHPEYGKFATYFNIDMYEKNENVSFAAWNFISTGNFLICLSTDGFHVSRSTIPLQLRTNIKNENCIFVSSKAEKSRKILSN